MDKNNSKVVKHSIHCTG